MLEIIHDIQNMNVKQPSAYNLGLSNKAKDNSYIK